MDTSRAWYCVVNLVLELYLVYSCSYVFVCARNNTLSLIKINCKYHNFIYFKQIAY